MVVIKIGFNVNDVKKNLKGLIKTGNCLAYSLNYKGLSAVEKPKFAKELNKHGIEVKDLPIFQTEYEIWYSEALMAIKILIPDRLQDFMQFYKNEKRKNISYESYTISDALIGLVVHRVGTRDLMPSDATHKLLQQVAILESAEKASESVINSLQFDIRADLFDSELDAGKGLLKAGFYRAAGAMCGVVLEKHFSQVCIKHEITITKKNPTIYDYNEALKNANLIDLPTFRYIQLLGDLRNICCHDKSIEPTKEQTNDLLSGTSKIIKTVF